MTTPPKARLFRLSRSESVVAMARDSAGIGAVEERKVRVEVHKGAAKASKPEAGGVPDMPFAPQIEDDGFGDMRFGDAARAPAAAETVMAGAGPGGMAATLAAIRAENLTDRQLRMARRIAAMNEIEVNSDIEAVALLRERGIDPFHRTEVGKILSTEGQKTQMTPAANTPVAVKPEQLPARMPPPQLPSREMLTEERRASEISRIQRDMARRRRRRLLMLTLRLATFVGLPTILAAYYYFFVASPLYATEAQFLIQQAEQSPSRGGGILSGSAAMINPDSVSVQSYLTSRDAMLRLDSDLGFKKAFQDPSIDPIQRLSPEASNEEAFKLYKRSVKIGYDPTEGVLNMEVIAPDPKLSQDFALALIKYAEGQVDQMTARLRSDQMTGTEDRYRQAEQQVKDAQLRVLDLQQKLGVLDPNAESSVVMSQVSELERQLNSKRLELGQLQANPNPNRSRVAGVQGDMARLQKMLDETRSRLTEGSETRGSLASIAGEIRIAESDLQTRQQLLSDAAAQMETARIEANKQVRYLSLSVAPIPPDRPTYPRAFPNTIVAFLIFAGIYLMLSLTASILREQVST
ncbi:capsule polysaccharide export inner-membrane protein [Paracoccus aminophilus]|uniref:Capsule polysaccharide export inner-membrane protein n=1 Tax=Paracoccus aminophilus JCM 7686 TaxID=1367847 RepID=S5YB01_PARAH|nr:capsule polysaccharide export inner-membrane protein [Paracoccus aminophilus]AGT08588.1 capsule polysaccharide export inner-membrane protein [Paracoccus aminophilus JCM 7686]